MIISTHENKNYRTISCLPFISSCAPNFSEWGGASPNCSLRPPPLAVSDQLIIFPKEECTQLKGEQTKEPCKIGFNGEKRGRRGGGRTYQKHYKVPSHSPPHSYLSTVCMLENCWRNPPSNSSTSIFNLNKIFNKYCTK